MHKCGNEGMQPCICGMLVCQENFSVNKCNHHENIFDSEDEEFKLKNAIKRKLKKKSYKT